MTSTYIPTSQAAYSPDSLFWLEKHSSPGKTTVQDITNALGEYERHFKAGIISKAELLTLHRAYPDSPTYANAAEKIQKMDMVEPLVIGGPASVELIDREGHLITTQALDRAFQKFMKNERTRNVMVLHSDVQVGWALPAYISKGGQIYKSGVGEKGLFFICELRDDTTIAKKVAEQINDGLLKSYSIAGSATKIQNMKKGMTPYMQVDEMELAEVTVCEKGVNQAANFDILKAELPQTGKVDKDQCGYRDATAPEMSLGINCGHCKYFNAERKTCDVVVGDIQPGDYCRLFEACGEDDQPQVSVHRKIVIMRSDNTGKINFRDSFLNWMEKESKDPLKGKSFTTLENLAGREAEHHRLLQEYGFPSEPVLETMRYIPVVETETDDDGKPINIIPPWVVNEAGQELGEKLDDDKPVTFNKSIDIFEQIIKKAAAAPPKRVGKANGSTDWMPHVEGVKQGGPETGGVTPKIEPKPSFQNPDVASQSPAKFSGEMGIPQSSREFSVPEHLQPSGQTSPVKFTGAQRTAASGSDKGPFPYRSPAGQAAQAANQEARQDELETGGPKLSRARGAWERAKGMFAGRQEDQEQGKIEDRREHLKRFGGTVTPEGAYDPLARGRQAGTPVEDQGRRQPVQGPGIRYRGGDDAASRNRADAVREARQARGQSVDPDAKDIVGRNQSQNRRDRMQNLSPRERVHQGMKGLFRGGRGRVREADQKLRDMGGVAENIGRGYRDESMDEGKGADWANQPARAVGRGARRAAEGARGAFRGFMKPDEDVRPDLPVSDHPAATLGETDNRLGAGSRERGGQMGRMTRQWLGRGARGAKGFGRGFMQDPDERRGTGPALNERGLGVAGDRGRGAGAKLRGFLDEHVGRGQQLGGEGLDLAGRAAARGVGAIEDKVQDFQTRREWNQQRQGAEGLGRNVQFNPEAHRNMSAQDKHNHVSNRLAHIQQGGNLSPKDWMSVVHHLSQDEDGNRFAHFTDMNFKADEWDKPISFADMKGHMGRNMRAHHGEHGGAGSQALGQIVRRLQDSHENGSSIELKPLRQGSESTMQGLVGEGQQGQQGGQEENPWDAKDARGPRQQARSRGEQRERGRRRGRGGRRAAGRERRRGAASNTREQPFYYSIQNAMTVPEAFIKAFKIPVRR